MRIHVYSMGWNEGRFLPFYLAHYGMFAERIVYFDNESDDETSQLLDAEPRCERRTIATQGQMRDDILVKIKNSAWKESRGVADWVVVCDVDELLYHPGLRQYLESCRDRGISMPLPTGYQMVSDGYPLPGRQVWEQLTWGRYDRFFSKQVIFDPVRVTEINYDPGAHVSKPEGEIVFDRDPSLKLLHYKYIGGVDFRMERQQQRIQRLSEVNRKYGWAVSGSAEAIAEEFAFEKSNSHPVNLGAEPISIVPPRKKVLFFASHLAIDHLLRPAALAASLDPSKYDVVLACESTGENLLEGYGLQVVQIAPLFDENLDPSRDAYSQVAAKVDAQSLEAGLLQDLKILERVSPDVVIGELRPSLSISCRVVDIPYINIVDPQASPHVKKDGESGIHPLGLLPGVLLGRAVGAVAQWATARSLHLTRLKFGLGLSLSTRKALTDGDYVAYAAIPGLYSEDTVPFSHTWLGPIRSTPGASLKIVEWRTLSDDKPVVYVNLRSSDQAAIGSLVMQALEPLVVSIVIVEGIDEDAVRKATLVICDGGSLSGQQALAAGVPILGLAQTQSQKDFMSLVRRSGAGESQDPLKVTAGNLQRVIWRMLMRRDYRERAQALAANSQRYDSAKRLGELINVASRKAI